MSGYVYDGEGRLLNVPDPLPPHDYLDALRSTTECWRRHVRAQAPRRELEAVKRLQHELREQRRQQHRPGEIVVIPAPPMAWEHPVALGLALGAALALCAVALLSAAFQI